MSGSGPDGRIQPIISRCRTSSRRRWLADREQIVQLESHALAELSTPFSPSAMIVA